MAIKLRVISDQYRDLGENRARVFGVNGGSIGRAPDNDWVLPDQKRLVSGHHCDIEYRSGGYWLRDRSTNGVFLNEGEEPVSDTGPVALQDGDRLRLGDYEILVSLDDRIDFLPAAAELHSAEKHLDSGLGAKLDLDSLFSPRDEAVGDEVAQDTSESSSSISIRNAFGLKLSRTVRRIVEDDAPRPARTLSPPGTPPDEPPPPPAGSPPADWALKTNAVSRQELADALARRQRRIEARQQTLPFHQQASSWADLKSAVQAFCRGAGLDPSTLSAEAQTMLPLVAGQLLREVVVGLADVQLARGTAGPATPQTTSTLPGSNPLRSSTGTEQALTRLFESHGRSVGGPVEALRDVLLDTKEHEAAVAAGVRAGLEALLGQLAPSNVADQFEQGRARTLAPGQDPRPKYWEHYGELFRVIAQNGSEGIPHPYAEAYAKAYEAARAEQAARRAGRADD
ncbi:MAG: type VI secretion system-associated FHA domain protein TagH [Steroidobacteraceae bacterium]